MKVSDTSHVSIEYALSLDSGEVVDKSEPGAPMGFLMGAHQIVPGLERELEGLASGDTAQVTVEPGEGYGPHDSKLYRDLPRDSFPNDVELRPGMGFEANGPHGPVFFRVKSVGPETVVADFNHPLAGERLHFDVRVVDVREPTAEELAGLASAECSPSDCSCCGGGCG